MIIKLSHSILSAWEQGRYEDAVAMYLQKEFPTSPEQRLGRAKHELWAKEILATGCMPAQFGGAPLIAPVVEQKYQKLINFGKYQVLLRGVVDLSNEHEITEFKCGMTPPTTYVESMQFDLYKLLLPQVTIGKYFCYNPYFKNYSVGIKYLTPKNAKEALNYIATFASEIVPYLEANGYLVDYTRRMNETEAKG